MGRTCQRFVTGNGAITDDRSQAFGNVGLIVPNGKDQLNSEKGYATYNKR